MVRRRRLFIPGLPQHIVQRGNNRSNMFSVPSDYELFLLMLYDASRRYDVEVYAYVLMTNHVHMIVTPHTPRGIARMLQSVGSRYVGYFNKRHGRTGTLFEGRYRASVIDTDLYFLQCLRYVELNPVRAGLVSRPEAYAWSSYQTHALGAPDPLLVTHPLYLQLGPTPDARQVSWQEICAVALPPEDLGKIREAIHHGQSLGPVRIPPEE
jgi:putative transposase